METSSSSPALREQLRKATLYGGLLLAAGALTVAARIIPYLVDDAYVTFRFADNLAHGLGLRFNRHLPPVDGSESPLWTLLLTPLAKWLGATKLPSLAMLLGIVAFAASIFLTLRLGRLRQERTLPAGLIGRLLPAALWCLSAGAIFSAVTGTGTMLFIVLVLLVHGAIAGALPGWTGLVAGALVPWAGTDGAWIVVAIAGQILLDAESRKERGWLAAALVGVALVSGGVLAVGRHRIFEEWIPSWSMSHPRTLSAAVHSFLRELFGSPSGVVLLCAGLLGGGLEEKRHRGYLAAALAWLCLLLLLTDDSPGAFRLQPAMALFALAAGGLAAFESRVRRGSLRSVVGLTVLAICVGDATGIWRQLHALAEDELPARDEQLDVVHWLKSTPASYLATAEPGVFGYFQPTVDIVDFKGQVGPQDLDYLFLYRTPQVIILRLRLAPLRDGAGKLVIPPALAASPEERRVLEDPRFPQHYKLLFVASASAAHGYARAIYRSNIFAEIDRHLPKGDLVELPHVE